MSRYFPLFIDLEKKKITVIGAGTIASRRIRTLLNFGAQITVLAPEASEEVRKLAEKGRLVWRKGAYARSLLYKQRINQGTFIHPGLPDHFP